MRKLLVFSILLAVLLLAAAPMLAQDAAPASVNVRVANFTADIAAADLYLNGALSGVTNLKSGNATIWIELNSGTQSIALVPTGQKLDASGVTPVDVELPAGAWVTIAAVGSLEKETLKPVVLVEDFSEIPAGQARVSVVHAIEGAEPVDILADGAAVIRTLAYPGTREANDGLAVVTVPSNAYDLQVVPFGRGTPVLLDLPNTFLASGVNYLVAAVGTPDAPQVKVIALNVATGAAPKAQKLGDLITSVGDLSKVAALGGSAFFKGGTSMLNQAGPFTVFMPTNAAFDRLREAQGYAALKTILDDPNGANTRYIILYHVVPGKYLAADLTDGLELSSASGESIVVTSDENGKLFLNGTIELVSTDIVAANGVLHIITDVLLPPEE